MLTTEFEWQNKRSLCPHGFSRDRTPVVGSLKWFPWAWVSMDSRSAYRFSILVGEPQICGSWNLIRCHSQKTGLPRPHTSRPWKIQIQEDWIRVKRDRNIPCLVCNFFVIFLLQVHPTFSLTPGCKFFFKSKPLIQQGQIADS